MKKADLGLVGLAVMGENLALNIERNGYVVAVANRSAAKVTEFIAGRGKNKNFIGCQTLAELAAALTRPRKVMLMVKAGAAVDELIAQLRPLLEPGDIIIDGGNSFFEDTRRRCRDLAAGGIRYLGVGISGGEEGALNGPSIMPGGDVTAWPEVRELFQKIAARAGDRPCCEWVGPDGAGHYVKMVHNGIEYADMELIGEAYWILKNGLELAAPEIAEIFAKWNRTELSSYLIEITADILRRVDPETGKPLVDVILDRTGQKGTGKWTSESALELGAATPTITEAVFARSLSARKESRLAASAILPAPGLSCFLGHRSEWVEKIRRALYVSKICAYSQGFELLKLAAARYGWDLHYGEIALMWREGCIIRAEFLDRIKAAYDRNPALENLLLDPFFRDAVSGAANDAWREVVSEAILRGIPAPGFASALTHFDGLRAAKLPANLLQAQRDYFGAHTFERVDRESGVFFHFDWKN